MAGLLMVPLSAPALTGQRAPTDTVGVRVEQLDLTRLPTVAVRFVVRDTGGRFLQGLGLSDLSLTLDGATLAAPTLTTRTTAGGAVAVAFVVDASGSTAAVLPAATASLGDLLAALGEDVAVALIAVGESAFVAAQAGAPRASVLRALAALPRGSRTALYDGIALGARALAGTASPGRRYVIALTDGRDNASRLGQREAIAAASAAATPVFIVSFATRPDTAAMLRVAAGTGGRLYWWSDESSLRTAYNAIAGQIASEYRLVFDVPPGESWRTLAITLLAPPANWPLEGTRIERAFLPTLGPGLPLEALQRARTRTGLGSVAAVFVITLAACGTVLLTPLLALAHRGRLAGRERGAAVLTALVAVAVATLATAAWWYR